MWVQHIPLQVTWPFEKKVSFCLTKPAHDIATLLKQPMTNNRDLERLISLFPVFKYYIEKLEPWASIADLWCGQWVAALDLSLLEKNFSVTGIDQQQPNDTLLSSPLLRHKWWDLESNILRDSIPDHSFDFMYSFFTCMYLKDPFTLVNNIRQKLAYWWTAFIHLWYLEQYEWWKQFLEDQLLKKSPSARLIVRDDFWTPLLPVDKEQPSVGNISILLHPVVLMFTKKDTFSPQPLTATQGVYFTHGWQKYQTQHSDKWYIYSTAQK